MDQKKQPGHLRFGSFEFDPGTGELSKNGRRQAFRCLRLHRHNCEGHRWVHRRDRTQGRNSPALRHRPNSQLHGGYRCRGIQPSSRDSRRRRLRQQGSLSSACRNLSLCVAIGFCSNSSLRKTLRPEGWVPLVGAGHLRPGSATG